MRGVGVEEGSRRSIGWRNKKGFDCRESIVSADLGGWSKHCLPYWGGFFLTYCRLVSQMVDTSSSWPFDWHLAEGDGGFGTDMFIDGKMESILSYCRQK